MLKVLGTIEEEQRSKPQDEYLAALRRRANEIHAALDWVFSAAGEPETGLALTIAAVPLWFELARMMVARSRVEDALRYAEAGSEPEMRLWLALGHAHRYSAPGHDAMEKLIAYEAVLRIPTKAATYSNLIAATIPI